MLYTTSGNQRLTPGVSAMVKNKTDLKFSPHRNRSARRSLTRSKSANSSSSSGNVKVVVRLRPPNTKELGDNSRTIVRVVSETILNFDPKENCEPFFYHGVQQRGRDLLKKSHKDIQFVFDKVFGFDADNDVVFEDSTKDLIGSIMSGYNCSVFVYGATGAGKTHTMLGNDDSPGITFLTMQELFQQMEELKEERKFELGITYLEVYNETVKDLLNPSGPLHLREDGKFGVCVAGLKLHRIQNADELFILLAKGNANRTQHPTDANAESSRSHAVFQVYVNMSERSSGERRIAKLSMIDLAGSERGAATGCTGMRFTEGANINKSLLALGNCINSLADGHKHIPYRDSKLTRLLKDSLGGNCRTVMIANVSPSSLNYEDTYNTLKYALRAKKIKSNMKKNVVNCELSIPQYMKLVDELNKENADLKAQLEERSAAVSCACNGEATKPTEEPTWTDQLRSLLKENRTVDKRIHRFLYAENVLELRVKFKESFEGLMTELCVDDEQLQSGRSRILNSVRGFQRQASGLHAQLEDLQNQKKEIDIKIQTLIEQECIPEEDNIEILKNDLEKQTVLTELGEMHIKKVSDLFQNEVDHREKLIIRLVEVVQMYYKLLLGHGHVTEEMTDTYRSLVRMAQGLRSVSWQDENEDLLSPRRQDAGVTNCSASNTRTKAADSVPIQDRLKIIEETYSNKRNKVQRKLYDVEMTPSKSCPAADQPTSSTTTENNLDTDVDLPQSTLNADAINNTFSLHNKEPKVLKKKATFKDFNNAITADNILPKAYKHLPSRRLGQTTSTMPGKYNKENNNKASSNKQFTTFGRGQRFPLRNKCPDTGSKTGRGSKL